MGVRFSTRITIVIILCFGSFNLLSCGVLSTTYDAGKGAVKATYKAARGITAVTIGTVKVVYHVGKFTFKVAMAPISWPLTHEEIESIDGLPPKEAIKKGRVKNSPYVVNGKKYVPMTVEASKTYREVGIASWYGYETRRKKDGHMTANGEAFDPKGLSAAHKHLPLLFCDQLLKAQEILLFCCVSFLCFLQVLFLYLLE